MLKSQAAPRKSARMKSPAIMASKARLRARRKDRLVARFVDRLRSLRETENMVVALWGPDQNS